MLRVVSHSIPLGSNWARSMGTLPAPSPVRFSPRPDGYWPPEPWCSRGDGRLMCGVYGAVRSIDIKSQWALCGNSMCQWKPNIHYIFLATVDLHIHTHTPQEVPDSRHLIWHSLPCLSTRQLASSLTCPQVVPYKVYMVCTDWTYHQRLEAEAAGEVQAQVEAHDPIAKQLLQTQFGAVSLFFQIFPCRTTSIMLLQYDPFAKDEWTSRRQWSRRQRFSMQTYAEILCCVDQSQLVHLT